MLGFMFSKRECNELYYILRSELNELLYDLMDSKLDEDLRKLTKARYKVILKMFSRFASKEELIYYVTKLK